jgi:hypothetical protein
MSLILLISMNIGKKWGNTEPAFTFIKRTYSSKLFQ